MSDIQSNATTTLYINGKPAQDELKRLRNTLQDYKKQLVEVAADSKRGIGSAEWKRLTNEIKSTEKELKSVQSGVASVSQVLLRLDKATPKELKNTLKQLKKELENIERGSKAWNAHVEKIKAVKAELAKLNDETKEHESLWSRFAKKMFEWGAGIQVTMAAITGVTMTARKAVDAYASMEQEMANVRKFTGMTAEQVEDLNEEFKKMDTRTSREGLNQLAQEAGRLGKSSKEDILGFVRAADQINVALDDLGEGATLTLSKLTNIFGDEERYGTEQALLKVGSVINELSQNCSASAPYIAEFASRLGGTGAQAKMSVQQIMAYGAVLDSAQQNVESASTALSQVIVKLYRDPAKYANAAGLDVQKFTELLKKDANEAVLTLLETLNKAGGMDVLAPMFADMGEKGARSVQTLSVLAKKIDEVRSQQEVANKAFEDGTSVTKEFDVQNNTVQAGLEKAKKNFNEIAVKLGQHLLPLMKYTITTSTVLMKVISGLVSFVVEYRAVIIPLTVAIVAYNAAIAAAALKAKVLVYWQKLLREEQIAVTAAQTLANAALHLFNLRLKEATVCVKQFYSALIKNPLAMVAALVGAVVAVIYEYAEAEKEAQARIEEERKQQRELMKDYDVAQKKIKNLTEIINDNTRELDERKTALDTLKEIVPGYHADLTKEGELINNNTDALDDYLAKLKESILLKANREKLEKAYVELSELEDVENEKNKKYHDIHSTNTLQGYNRNGFIAKLMRTLGMEAEDNAKKEADAAASDTRAKRAEVHALEKKVGVNLLDQGSETPQEDGNNGNSDNNNHHTTSSTSSKSSKNSKSEDKFKAEKEWRQKEEALNRIAYTTGEKDYEAYTQRIDEIAVDFYKKQLERTDLSELERLTIMADAGEAKKKQTEHANAATIAEEKAGYDEMVAYHKQCYIDGELDATTYQETMQQLELAHLKRMTEITVAGTKERAAAVTAYQDKVLKDQQEKQKKAEEEAKKHQEQLKKIREDVFGNSAAENKAAYDVALANLTAVFNAEIAAAGDNAKEKLRIEKAFQDAKLALAKQYNQEIQGENSNLLEQMAEGFLNWADSDGGKAVTQSFDTVVSQMGSIFSGLSSLIQAELEIQTAAIEKRYDKEISRAEGNSYKVAQLEKNKEKEIAKAKNEANRKMFAMQVIQAVAQTAQNALAAYGSALATPIVGPYLAPIAAAMAVAAGAIQIAAIKKQQEASNAQGYAEGGFTPKGGKYEEVGVVHAGEWVASQKLLANPQARAVVNMLDFAQRTNTIGSIRSADVSRSISAPMAIANLQTSASGTAASPQVGSSRAQTDAVITELSAVIYDLKQRLNEPFVTVNTVTGDAGIKKAQDEYEQLMKNKSPKSRR